MPFTASELTEAGYASLDFYEKNHPIDQIAEERPLFKRLMAEKKTFPGAKENVVAQIRYSYNSNFQWFSGDDEVSYNHRNGLQQAYYPWRSCHDGYALNEDELLQNGITFIEGKGGNNTGAEREQLTNMLTENNEELHLGFQQKFSQAMHQDGTQSADAVAGLDFLVPSNPTTGTVGGLNRATNTWWQSQYVTGLTGGAASMISSMEQTWRNCIRNGGRPNLIIAGEAFLDAYASAAGTMITRFKDANTAKGEYNLDPSTDTTENLSFHGIPLTWDPEFLDLDDLLSPTIHWQKRCYFLNTKFLRLRPASGQDMITRKPPRVYNRYTYYFGLTWRGALTMNRSNCHAFISIT